MKKDLHPTYFETATVKCACGAIFTLGSTHEHIDTEICSQCHPFYTGKGKLVDTAGRIEKYRARLEMKEKLATPKKKVKTKKSAAKPKAKKK